MKSSRNNKKKEEPAYLKYGTKRYSGPKKELKENGAKVSDGSIRLNKYIANSGICSRREADELITVGAVTVNGKIVTELGTKVFASDKIQYEGQTIKNEKKVYILLNKPKNYVCALDDPLKRRTILDLVKNACKVSVYAVSKVDRSTTGVLLLTNDNDLTLKLTHPKHLVKKIYHITLDKEVSFEHFSTLQEGLMVENKFVKPNEVAWANKENKFEIGMEIHSNKENIVKKIFEHLEYKIVKLDRVYYAGLTKKGLERGKFRFLTDLEVGALKMLG